MAEGDFLDEMAQMMIQSKSNEKGYESFEERQQQPGGSAIAVRGDAPCGLRCKIRWPSTLLRSRLVLMGMLSLLVLHVANEFHRSGRRRLESRRWMPISGLWIWVVSDGWHGRRIAG